MKKLSLLLVLIWSSVAFSLTRVAGDCRGIDQWVSGSYGWVADTQLVVHNNLLWGHQSWVSGEPGKDGAWVRKDTCVKTGSLYVFDTTWAKSSSSQSSSSSQAQIETKVTWTPESYSSLRCDLTGKNKDTLNRACIYPAELEGALIRVPRNVTRVSKDMFTLCQLTQDGSQPTVIAYIMDYSGSMSTSDPSVIAPDAVKSSIEKQFDLDPFSYAGFYAFSDKEVMSVEPVRLNLADNKSTLLNRIQAQYGGNTLYYPPIKSAMGWLNQAKFKDYRKAIIFVSDGQPGDAGDKRDSIRMMLIDSLKNNVNPIVLHGLFLNKDSSGSGTLKAMASYGKDANGNPGTFTWIKTAPEMAAVIQSIVKNSMVNNTPIGMRILHEKTQQFISASNSDLKMQPDSAVRVGLNTNLSLVPGENKMSFQTLYRSLSGDTVKSDIFFTVSVQDSAYNQEIDITGTPFATACYEPNMLRIYPDKDSLAKTVQKKNSTLWVQFKTIEPAGFGDSVRVQIYSATGDSMVLNLPKIQNTVPITYGKSVSIEWQKTAVLFDAKAQLQPLDNVVGMWKHPTDAQDASRAEIPVLWPMAHAKSARLWDVNHDGRLDSISFETDRKAEEWMIPAFDLRGNFWANGSNAESRLDWSAAGEFKVSKDSSLYWSAKVDKMGVWTGLPSSAWTMGTKNGGKWIDSATLTVIDSMKPVLVRARISYKDKQGENADLTLRFSEPMQKDSLRIHPAFEFMIKGVRNNQPQYANSRWSNALEIKIPFVVDDPNFSVEPEDSIRMKVGAGYLVDTVGHYAWEQNPFVLIDGELPVRVKAKTYSESYPGEDWDSSFVIQKIPENADPVKWLESQERLSVVLGPFKIAKDSSNPIFNWRMEVFDFGAQYLTSQSGQFDCSLAENADACQSKEGIYLGMTWNHRDEKGRKAGTGAYLMRVKVNGLEKMVRMGLSRIGTLDP